MRFFPVHRRGRDISPVMEKLACFIIAACVCRPTYNSYAVQFRDCVVIEHPYYTEVHGTSEGREYGVFGCQISASAPQFWRSAKSLLRYGHFDPHFEEVSGGVEPWLMARWKARVEFFLYLLRSRRYKAKCVKTRCLQEWVGHLEPKFQGKGSSLGNIFGFYKTRHILLSDSANCTVLRAVVLTQYRRVTDRRTDGGTDGITVANTALAMRALWRAVKMHTIGQSATQCYVFFSVGLVFDR